MSQLLHGINEMLTTVFSTAPIELFRILPNSILFMSGFFALITVSFPYTILFGSLLESLGIFYALQSVVLNFNVFDVFGGKHSYSSVCNTGFNSVSFNEFTERMPGSIGFPSFAIYTLSFITSYLLSMYTTYTKELNALNDTRFFQSALFLAAILVVTCIVRMLFNCDGVGTMLASILFGGLAGFLIVQQNIALFGKGSLNLLGIPLLNGKAANGQALYICPTAFTS